MPPIAQADARRLQRGSLVLELTLSPFTITVRRSGRRLLRAAGAWVAEGRIADRFIHLTEGVVAHEDRAPAERAVLAEVQEEGEDWVRLGLVLQGGRRATLGIELQPALVTFELEAEGDPLRLALDWDRRSEERITGLGLRHATALDQVGRDIQLGADRAYTGPDCPAEMRDDGGIPQGDCAPQPWAQSSRGYAVWVETDANGTRFDLAGERITVSTRAVAGPLRLHLLCGPTPLSRLRALGAYAGLPMLLPEWAYGFWKSRDIHEHQDDVHDDHHGFRRHDIPLDAIVIDSPWATQYNTWEFNPHQFPDAPRLIRGMREDGVRTVVWCTGWINLDSRDGQIPPQPESRALHALPASNYAEAADHGHLVREPSGEPHVGRWWMGEGSLVDLSSPAAEAWWRSQVRRVLELGVEGIKADDGDGFYIPEHVRLADGRSGAEGAWALGGLHRLSLQRALDEVHPGTGVLFGRSGWTGQHATGLTWAGDQASDFWSLRVLLVALLSGAISGGSNLSHDVGGYLGKRLIERCAPELLVRWLQLGCFTPLMHAHGRLPQEPWHYSEHVLNLYRAYVRLHEQLVPYVRAAARTAARTGVPIMRPLCLTDPSDPRGWSMTDAFGYGPALWVAPVLDEGASEREVALPRGQWIETWSGAEARGGGEVIVATPLERIPVWVRRGSIVVTHPVQAIRRGLADCAEHERPLTATLWGEPPLGATAVRLADGTRIGWRHGHWELPDGRPVATAER